MCKQLKLLIINNRGYAGKMLEKTVRFKKNHEENKNNNRGCKCNKYNKNKNRNYRNGNPTFSNKNKAPEIISYMPKLRGNKRH